jgi:trans-2-enoyl-CoA reductase
MDLLMETDVLAENAKPCAYAYIGIEMTRSIYAHGTICRAKDHLEWSAKNSQNK